MKEKATCSLNTSGTIKKAQEITSAEPNHNKWVEVIKLGKDDNKDGSCFSSSL